MPERMAKKKAVINPEKSDEECFKCVFIAALYSADIGNNPECKSNLQLMKTSITGKDLIFW